MSNVIAFPGPDLQDGVPICRRCRGAIPTNATPGAYTGALSRADNRTEVCSACGTEEAEQDAWEGGATPIEDWPLDRGRAWTGATHD